MNQFIPLGLAEPLLRAIEAEGYTSPTPIQARVVPAMMAGSDVLGIAQTGTGKTAAFVLPILDGLTKDPLPAKARTCKALILAPTRELAAQIADNIRAYGKHSRPSVAVIVGGAKIPPQIKALATGVDIIVATPGRLLDHLGSRNVRLDSTHTVVLDEADQMFDLGFMPQIRKLLAALPPKRQTVLLSATMPKAIHKLAQEFLKNPVEVTVTPNSKPIDRIDQKVLQLQTAAKRNVLVDYLSLPDMDRAIVFTRTKRGADKVCQHLEQYGFKAAAIHGNKSQNQRVRSLASFRNGNVRVLVATDIAARGIDVDDVSHVVNFELPNVPEAYVHRVGRTARAGKSGQAMTLCDNTERSLLRDIERLIKRKLDVGDFPPPSGREKVEVVAEPVQQQQPRKRKQRSSPTAGAPGAARNRARSRRRKSTAKAA
ncbi:DEAD/DEAH box helicase [Pyruvatibacter sp.]|uniref:DEAD/DEAH box helicase n=1 Tax=Pyruvatibacter sp. TaxID=1981328 RepID=UPI0032EBF4D4